eukprot:1656685-Pleurochrysis_carterae.AAC.1
MCVSTNRFTPGAPNSGATSAIAQRTDGDAAQPPGLLTADTPSVQPAKSGLEGPQHLLSDTPTTARSRRALLLFSGPIH